MISKFYKKIFEMKRGEKMHKYISCNSTQKKKIKKKKKNFFRIISNQFLPEPF
jgi:hypothetical protein